MFSTFTISDSLFRIAGLGLVLSSCGPKPSEPNTNLYDSGVITIDHYESDARDSRISELPPMRTNTAPFLNPIPDQAVNEGEVLEIRLAAIDREGDRLTYRSETSLPTGANLDNSSGIFRWTPNYRQAGRYVMRFIVSDGFLEDSQSVNITVNDVPLDNDRDGYRDNVDCDDNNPAIRPLTEFSVTMVTSNLTICPGTYRGVNLVVMADDITINATGAILESVMGTMEWDIQIRNRNGVTIQGITVRDSGTNRRGIGIWGSHHIVLDRYSFMGSAGALFLGESQECRVTRAQFNGGFSFGSVYFLRSRSNTIETMTSVGHSLLLEASRSNTIVSSSFTGYGPTFSPGGPGISLVGGSDSNTIRGNRISDLQEGISIGSRSYCPECQSSDNHMEGNIFERNSAAINIWGGQNNQVGSTRDLRAGNNFQRNGNGVAIGQYGRNNFVLDNRFEVNGEAIRIFGEGDRIERNILTGSTFTRTSGEYDAALHLYTSSRGAMVVDNQVYDNLGHGLVAFGGPHTLTNNFLRNNRYGNFLGCTSGNRCSGNTE